jgi:hypothetical protein
VFELNPALKRRAKVMLTLRVENRSIFQRFEF